MIQKIIPVFFCGNLAEGRIYGLWPVLQTIVGTVIPGIFET